MCSASLGDRRARETSRCCSLTRFDRELPICQATPSRDEALTMVQGWMQHIGPTTVPELAGRLGLPPDDVDDAMLRLEAAGAVASRTASGLEPAPRASSPSPSRESNGATAGCSRAFTA